MNRRRQSRNTRRLSPQDLLPSSKARRRLPYINRPQSVLVERGTRGMAVGGGARVILNSFPIHTSQAPGETT